MPTAGISSVTPETHQARTSATHPSPYNQYIPYPVPKVSPLPRIHIPFPIFKVLPHPTPPHPTPNHFPFPKFILSPSPLSLPAGSADIDSLTHPIISACLVHNPPPHCRSSHANLNSRAGIDGAPLMSFINHPDQHPSNLQHTILLSLLGRTDLFLSPPVTHVFITDPHHTPLFSSSSSRLVLAPTGFPVALFTRENSDIFLVSCCLNVCRGVRCNLYFMFN